MSAGRGATPGAGSLGPAPGAAMLTPRRPRKIYIRKIAGRWTWECERCQPPVPGATLSFDKTVRNVARHCRTRYYHHEYVRRTYR